MARAPQLTDRSKLPALTAKQRAFSVEYMKDHDAKNAYMRANPSVKGPTAGMRGLSLLKNPAIRYEIDFLEAQVLDAVRKSAGVDLDRTVREIARTAFYDVRKLFNADGSPKDITDLDDDTAAAIEGVEVIEQYIGKGEDRQFVGTIKKYKLTRKTAGLDMLMKHLNGYRENNAAAGEGAVNAMVTFLDGMRRSALPVVYDVPRDEHL